jgi:hypothetical protein
MGSSQGERSKSIGRECGGEAREFTTFQDVGDQLAGRRRQGDPQHRVAGRDDGVGGPAAGPTTGSPSGTIGRIPAHGVASPVRRSRGRYQAHARTIASTLPRSLASERGPSSMVPKTRTPSR